MERSMTGEFYPILIVPEEFRGRGHFAEYDPDVAQQVFDWTMSNLGSRIDGLLSYFDKAYPEAGNEYPMLLDLGVDVASALRQRPNFRELPGGTELTAPGLSMAYDIGLLVGDLVVRSGRGDIRWKLGGRGSASPNSNRAVLTGRLDRLTIEPIRQSISHARLILQGADFTKIWAWYYVNWLIRLTSDHWMRPNATLARAREMGFPLDDYREIAIRERDRSPRRSYAGPILPIAPGVSPEEVPE
jgi:hypothetical protein